MSRHDVLVMAPYPEWDMQALDAAYTLHRFWEAADKAAFLANAAKTVRAIATKGDVGVSGPVINALPKLEMISCYGVGVDAIDFSATRPRGIKVSNTPDVLTSDVADLALALMLAFARDIPAADKFVRDGKWGGAPFPLGAKLSGKRLGIVGMGRIGKAIAKRAAAFDMTISYFGRTKQADLSYRYHPTVEAVAADSDFLVASLAGGAATSKIISASALKALGPNSVFVNVARGSVVDEAALIEALRAKAIKGAALDVYNNEPNLDPRFLTLENVVLLPHIGSATVDTRKKMGQLMRDNLDAHFSGRPLLTPVA